MYEVEGEKKGVALGKRAAQTLPLPVNIYNN